MTASTESLALAAWVTRLSVPNGQGSYVYDLTTTGDVRLGSPTQTAARESVFIDSPVFTVDDTAGEVPLGLVRLRMEVQITGHVGSIAGTPGDRMRACADLWADIKRAVYADRTLGGTVLDAGVTGTVLQDSATGNYFVSAVGTALIALEAAP